MKVERNYEAVIEGQFGVRTVTGPGEAWEGPGEKIRAIVPMYELSFTLAGLGITLSQSRTPQFTLFVRYQVNDSPPAATYCGWADAIRGGKPPEEKSLIAAWQAQMQADIKRFFTELLWQQPEEYYTHHRKRLQGHLQGWLTDEATAMGLEILEVCILGIKP